MKHNVSKSAGENKLGTRNGSVRREALGQSVKSVLKRLSGMITDALFPRRCPICDEILEPEQQAKKIHPECRRRLYPVEGAVCMRCGRPLTNATGEYCYDCRRASAGLPAGAMQRQTMMHHSVSGVHVESSFAQGKSLFLYQGPIKQTMYRFKYSNKREYADFFAEEAAKRYGEWLREKQIEAIVPVPMYRMKQRLRGYNQAEAFAKALSKLIGISVDAGLIRRTVDTTPQKELNDVERKNNLKNAFQKCESIVQYSKVLVVDDIYTTGSTAQAVADELRKAGVNQIYLLSVCIGKGV